MTKFSDLKVQSDPRVDDKVQKCYEEGYLETDYSDDHHSVNSSSAAQIDTWHRRQGWKLGIGYHYVVRRDGQIELGRPEWLTGAHCRNHNAHSIGVCYEGGLDIRGKPADTRTEAQRQALRRLLKELKERYPRALIVGHRNLNPLKACPCFDAVKEYRDLQP